MPGEANYFSFQAKAGATLDAQIAIPAIATLEQFAPHLALTGSGLPASHKSITLTIPPGDGVQERKPHMNRSENGML